MGKHITSRSSSFRPKWASTGRLFLRFAAKRSPLNIGVKSLNMSENEELKLFIDEIVHRFPAVGEKMQLWLEYQGFDDFTPTAMMEAFSQATTEAMARRDEETVVAHLRYVSEKLTRASAKEREYIDVYYVESLMWNLDKQGKKWGWGLIPPNLKELYIGMWGDPDF
ncbi:DUF7674 family protein [Marinobacter shengliensis]|uniref:DUF7674 family protein n=1 Tax=Marinobacter shengliensis TaxID=1389223 RepID=UPI000D112EFA|nr:hypothetical protein [Marinobacter shengliensis]PSF14879.1 hypothetical protein C7H10_03210 [Marinobacter shengliensis]